MGLNGSNDLLRDHLTLSRELDTFAGRIVAQEQGGLALQGGTEYNNHPVRSLLTVKVARSLFAGIDVYGGAVFSDGQEGAVAGLEWDARVCKIQLPMVTYIPAGDTWYNPGQFRRSGGNRGLEPRTTQPVSSVARRQFHALTDALGYGQIA